MFFPSSKYDELERQPVRIKREKEIGGRRSRARGITREDNSAELRDRRQEKTRRTTVFYLPLERPPTRFPIMSSEQDGRLE